MRKKIGEALAHKLGIICDCPDSASADWEGTLQHNEDPSIRKDFVIQVFCNKCKYIMEEESDTEELADLMGISLDEL